MSDQSSISDSNRGFTIENNVIKGVKKTYDTQEKSIGKILLKVFNDNPDHVGQIEAETGKQTTFAEMRENSIRCALWMQKQGIKSGDLIGLCTHNQMDTYIPFVATFLVGAIQNPWYHELTLKSAQHFMRLTRPKLMFVCESAIDVLIKAANLENIDVRFIVFGKHQETQSLRDVMKLQTKEEVRNFELQEIYNPEDIALILFSSGTTGLPKAVQHSYDSVLKNTIAYLFRKDKDDIYLWYSSLYWISGTLCQLQSILTISTRILHANFDPEETCKIIEKYKVTFVFFSPLIISYLWKSNALRKYNLTSLKMIITGGSKLAYNILEELKLIINLPVIQVYGMTELGTAAAMQTNENKSIESIGFVTPNTQLKIIDLNTKQALGSNQPGELCIKLETKMVGYLNNLAATKEIIDEDGWLHSGDIAYYAENGELFIIDRIKEVMKVAGHHVSPSEIEEALISHPAIMEAVVIAVPHKSGADLPMAFVKRNPEIEVTEDELIKLTSELGEYKKISGGVIFMNELPHTASGKMNRKEIKEMSKAYVK